MRAVTSAVRIPVATGEQLTTLTEFAAALKTGHRWRMDIFLCHLLRGWALRSMKRLREHPFDGDGLLLQMQDDL